MVERRAGPAQVAARVRAALAYSTLGLSEVGERSGLGQPKLRRIASATNPRGANPLELWAIADACGVPREWLEAGEWSDLAGRADVIDDLDPFGNGSTEDRVELLERYVLALLRIEAARGGQLPLPVASVDTPGPLPRELPTGRATPRPRRRRGSDPDTSDRS